jgi:hypothetical protein
MTSDAPDGRAAVRPVPPEPTPPPLIHSSDHRDHLLTFFFPFHSLPTRASLSPPLRPRSPLPALPTRATGSSPLPCSLRRSHFPLFLTLLPLWLPSKLTAAAVSSAFHSSGSMGAQPPPWWIHGRRCRSSVVGASSTLARPPSPRRGHGEVSPAADPWCTWSPVVDPWGDGADPAARWCFSTMACLSHLDGGMGGLPRWGMHVAAAPRGGSMGGDADLVTLAALPLSSPPVSVVFFCCFICSKDMFQ